MTIVMSKRSKIMIFEILILMIKSWRKIRYDKKGERKLDLVIHGGTKGFPTRSNHVCASFLNYKPNLTPPTPTQPTPHKEKWRNGENNN